MNKNKLFFLILTVFFFVGCQVTGVDDPVQITGDSTEVLSSTDSAFINLEKEVKPILSDSVKNDSGTPMVWNRNDGLRIEWEKRLMNSPIKKGDLVLVNYEARVARGEVYDHNREAGFPLPLKLGIGQLVKGWEEGLLQMNVGDKGRIMIPSELGYGENGYLGKIPRNADIIVEIEIVSKVTPTILPEGVKVYKYKSENNENPTPTKNQAVTFHYFTYKTGKEPGLYDNSYAKGQPFTVKFENDNVVEGLHQGLSVLRANDHAFVEIPSKLAYGQSGLANLVPPNTDIVFDLRIESIK